MCALPPSRREFIRNLGLSVAAALASAGIAGKAGAAVPLDVIEGMRVTEKIRYPVPAADGVSIDKKNEVILVRWQGSMYAFNLSCPHQNTALRWEESQHRFKCPKHKSRYEPSGTFVDGRATRGMDRFTIAMDGAGFVSVDVGAMHKQDQDAAGWNAATVRVT